MGYWFKFEHIHSQSLEKIVSKGFCRWIILGLFDIFLLCVLSECSNSNTLGKLILFIPFPQD